MTDLLKRWFGGDTPETAEPVDVPIYERGRPLPPQEPFKLTWPEPHQHDWKEKRVTAIRQECSDCGAVQFIDNHRGRIKGQKPRKQPAK